MGLSPQNESFLAEIFAKQEFSDRDAALDKAVALLRRQHEIRTAIELGMQQLRSGQSHRYEQNEFDRFLADVEAREELRYGKSR